MQPALFIALAEELGLMEDLSRVMLRQALAQHRAWAAAGWVVPVSVNIGPACVASPAFPATVARLLREERVPGQMLALEVSEETGTTAASTTFFAQLAESGVRVSLDDFGTGFASLESLGGWPIDELKLDRSIVRPVVASASFRAIVATTVDLAHQLGIRVVAEGIESDAISSELKALRCDIGQGFFLGRPMAAAAFTEWMRDPTRSPRTWRPPATRRQPRQLARTAPGDSPAGRPAARPASRGAPWPGWRRRAGGRGGDDGRVRGVAGIPVGRARAPGADRRLGVHPGERGRRTAGLAGVPARRPGACYLPGVAPAGSRAPPLLGR